MFFTHSLVYDIFFVTILVLGIFVAATFINNNFKKGPSHKLISILLILLNFRIILTHLYLSKLMLDYPHLLLVTNLVSRIAVPLLFLIVYYEMVRSYWKWYDLLHFVPSLLFIFVFKDIYFGDAEYKRQLLIMMYEKGYDYVWSEGSKMHEYFVFFIRTGLLLLYIGLIIILLCLGRYFQPINRSLRLFFVGVVSFMIINLTPLFVDSLNYPPSQIAYYVTIANFLSTLFILIYFFFIPDFLYSKYFTAQLEEVEDFEEEHKESLVEEEYLDLFLKIEEYLKQTKLFLNPELTIGQLENGLKISDRKISLAIKIKTNLSFSSYINDLRINYLIETADKELIESKNFNEIAFEYGFNSVNSFFSYFKQKMGSTPRNYFKEKFKA